MRKHNAFTMVLVTCMTFLLCDGANLAQEAGSQMRLPNGRLLGEVPGGPRETNNLATAAAVSPDGRFVAFLHSGFGSYSDDGRQSISVQGGDGRTVGFPRKSPEPQRAANLFFGLGFFARRQTSLRFDCVLHRSARQERGQHRKRDRRLQLQKWRGPAGTISADLCAHFVAPRKSPPGTI